MTQTNTSPQNHVVITGVVERITFAAENDGYTVARLNVSGHPDLLTIVGNFANLQAGH